MLNKGTILLLVILILAGPVCAVKDTATVMYYNILGYPDNTPGRENEFRIITQYVTPDIILVNELNTNAGALTLLSQALNVYGTNHFQKAIFTNGPDSDNMLFYNSDKFTLYSQYYIVTGLRYINEYVLYFNSTDLSTGDTTFLRFYVAHLKAGTDPSNEQQRLDEVNLFRQRLEDLPDPENIFFGGDLNLYSSSEPAYSALTGSGTYPMTDPLPAGNWHSNYSYRHYHTQSTRTTVFGGGADGGLDDRFDFILFSGDVAGGSNGVNYITGSCKAFGNDGNHFNKSLIESPVNPNLPDSVIQALYHMSDHLPVICDIEIEGTISNVPKEIVISEILQNPQAALDSEGEWFELFNPTEEAINLNGWIIADNDYDHHVIGDNVVIPAKGFAVLGINADTATNGGYPCDYQYSGFFLSNGADEVIIYKPGGTEEADRVEYDGGPAWPDPAGASMVFTGAAGQDNNDVQFWTVATVREPEFSGSAGDNGSPGTNGAPQNLTGQSGGMLKLQVFLEGPFGVTEMNTSLNQYLPLQQPYNTAPWNYPGNESVQSIPGTAVVDWILIALRDAPDASQAVDSTTVERRAAFLRNDGRVTDLDGQDQIPFSSSINDSLYVVIYHRNHLPVMSSVALAPSGGIWHYDFSASPFSVYGGFIAHRFLAANIWGMAGADGDANGQVNNGDKNDVWAPSAGLEGYHAGDFNMDAQVNNGDKNDLWTPNTGYGSQVPD